MVSKCVVSYNLLINGVYGGYNPLTNHLLTSWDIQAKNKYSREDRTCTCANKDKVRLYSNNRTAGWQSVIDPHSGHVVAHRHIVSEPCKDKVETIMAAPSLPKVKPGLLIRDDVCHFEAHIKKQCKSCKHMMRTFKSIKYFVVGEFHRVNHKCVTKKNDHNQAEESANQYVWVVQRLDPQKEFRPQLHELVQPPVLDARGHFLLECKSWKHAQVHHQKIHCYHP